MLAESGEVADAENLLQDARYEAMHGAGRDTKVFADLNTDCVRMGIFAMLPVSPSQHTSGRLTSTASVPVLERIVPLLTSDRNRRSLCPLKQPL